MGTAWQECRYAFRRLIRDKRIATAAILTVALGIGPNVVVFSILRATILHKLPYPGSDSLVFISNISPTTRRAGIGAGQVEQWSSQRDVFEALAPINPLSTMILTGVAEPETLRVAAASPELCEVLELRPLAGRCFSRSNAAEDEVLISESLWGRHFDRDPTVTERRIVLSDRLHTVIGVVPDEFDVLRLIFPRQRSVDVWTRLAFTPEELAATWGGTLAVVARLQAGIETQAVSERLTSQMPAQNHLPQNVRNLGVNVETLHDAIFGETRPASLLLVSIGACVLLLACCSVINLLLTRTEQGRLDRAIRLALGAPRWRIAGEVLIDVSLIAAAGTALGFLLASWCVSVLPFALPADYPHVALARIDGLILVMTIVATALTIVTCGFLPVLASSSARPMTYLVGAGMTAPRHRVAFRNSLVVLEIALAIPLVGASFLLLRAFQARTSVSSGFEASQVHLVGISLPESRYPDPRAANLFQVTLQRYLSSAPGIRAAAVASGIPGIYPANGTTFSKPVAMQMSSVDRREAHLDYVSHDYFRALQIPLFEGRAFGPQDDAGSRTVAIIDTSAAKFLGPGSPIGKEILLGAPALKCEVIGVVGSVHLFGAPANTDPHIYLPFSASPLSTFALVLKTSLSTEDLGKTVRSTVHGIDPNLPIGRVVSLSQRIADQTSGPRFRLVMVGSMGLLAVALASSGAFSVMAYALSLRRRELAIRSCLGAAHRVLARMIVWNGVKLMAIGSVAGIAITWALTRVLASVFREVAVYETFAITAAVLVVSSAVLCAIAIPAVTMTRFEMATELRAP